MANPLQRLFGYDEAVQTQLREAAAVASTLSAQNLAMDLDRADLRESIRELSLYIEDLNWIPVDGWEEEKGFSIDIIKEQSDRLRALLTVNPTIKKAVNARVGYIHGRGVSFEGPAIIKKTIENEHNDEVIFSDTAKWKLEAQLATDGNLWSARNKKSNEITMVPIHHIAGWVVDENDPSRVLYWLRKYTVMVKNFSNGVEAPKYIEEFIPAYGFTSGTVGSIDGIKVNRNLEMVHLAVNRQEGWILGIPDIMAAMFWAKGMKELYESGTAYVKAQGKFASKVISKTQAGAQRAAAAVAEGPRRDETTGQVLDIGGTAVMSAGLDMQLMGKMSGGVDFKSFDPVVGLVAVALDLPLSVLLGTADGEEKSLEQTTVDAMKLRQKTWSWYFKALLGPSKVTVVWPKIKTEPTYRQIQSIGLSNDAATLSREELRLLTLEAYDLYGDPKKVPDIEQNAKYLMQKLLADNAAENAADAAKTAAQTAADALPKQGVTGEVGKLSTGKDAKASRNNKADPNTKNT